MHLVLTFMLGYFLFFLTSFFSFFIPGNLLLMNLKLKQHLSFFERQILSWFVGISIFLLVCYTTAYLGIPQIAEIILSIAGIIWLTLVIRFKKKLTFTKFSFDIPSTIIIVIGSIAITSLMFFSDWQTSTGIQFFATNSIDGIRHIAYITDQITHFPPQEPSIAGEPLKGFHYFYDFILSRFSLFYGFSVGDLYFRYFPLLDGLFYGLGFVLFTKAMRLDKITQQFILFLAYFSRSSVLFLTFFNHSLHLADDAIVQPLALIINPFIVFSLAMLLAGLSLLPQIKNSWKFGILIGLLFGVLSQIKVYSGLIAIGCLVLYGIYLITKYRNQYLSPLMLTLCITALLTVYTFFPNNFGSGGLIFAPLLFFEHYMQTDLFAPFQWANRLTVYQQLHDYIGITALYTLAVSIFIALNLGIRLLVIVKVKKLFSHQFWMEDTNFILFWALSISLCIPSFFIQSISVFDTIQFFWITLVLLCIPTGIILTECYIKIRQKPLQYLLVLFVIAISIPGTSATVRKYMLASNPVVIPMQDAKILQEISKFVPNNKFITLLPPSPETLANYPFPQGTPFVAAMTGRQMYYEEGWLPTQDETKYQVRERNILALQKALTRCIPEEITSLVKEIGSPYIMTLGTYPCLPKTFTVVQQNEAPNGLVNFYQVKF